MNKEGIEYQFVDFWSEWDLLEEGVFYFFNVSLKQPVFPFEIDRDNSYDMVVNTNNCTVEIYQPNVQDKPVFTSNFKVILA